MSNPTTLEELFIHSIINQEHLRSVLYLTKPNHPTPVRSKAWKVLLGYLPTDQLQWDSAIKKKHKNYFNRLNKLYSIFPSLPILQNPTPNLSPTPNPIIVTVPTPKRPSEGIIPEQPPRPSSASKFSTFQHFHSIVRSSSTVFNGQEKYKDKTDGKHYSIKNINNDVPRTEVLFIMKKWNGCHHEALKRILYCLVMFDQVKYTQGMNEIVAVLYYVFAVTPNTPDLIEAEVATYYCSQRLLKEFSPYFDAQQDNQKDGITAAMKSVIQRLKEEDKELYNDLEMKGIGNALYLMRWMTLLLTGEFPMESLICLWDRLLSQIETRKYLINFCVAMILSIKNEILNSTPPQTVKILQKFPQRNFMDLDFFTKFMLKYPGKLRFNDDHNSSLLSDFMSYRVLMYSPSTESTDGESLFN
ncbi:Rab-GAP TBC domain-containing protein [Entamoeba marina]